MFRFFTNPLTFFIPQKNNTFIFCENLNSTWWKTHSFFVFIYSLKTRKINFPYVVHNRWIVLVVVGLCNSLRDSWLSVIVFGSAAPLSFNFLSIFYLLKYLGKSTLISITLWIFWDFKCFITFIRSSSYSKILCYRIRFSSRGRILSYSHIMMKTCFTLFIWQIYLESHISLIFSILSIFGECFTCIKVKSNFVINTFWV